MDAREYDTWYETPRGRWVGRREVELVHAALTPRPGESLLDVGCGTGFFTRELACRMSGTVVGVDINPDWVAFAHRHDAGRASYAVADARALPFPDASFDCVVSVAAICFIPEETTAISEIVRVTRRRFALGLLNKSSLLWMRKGRGGGRGAYRGAHWHTVLNANSLFRGLPVRHLRVRTALHVQSGGLCARLIERAWPPAVPTGAFILVTGDARKVTGISPCQHLGEHVF